MKRKFPSIIDKILPVILFVIFIALWQILCQAGVLPEYMLPSPYQVVRAFIGDFPLIMDHMKITIYETFLGLAIGTLLGFFLAVIMDCFEILYKCIYPMLVVSQTIPTVAIAPLLVLWMGYGVAPKITLIVLIVFFPVAACLIDGFKDADADEIKLLETMGANKFQIFWHIKLPGSMSRFFGGLRIAVAYAVVGAVVSEWLGGYKGLGVYMTRVKKSYSYDKMFAVIVLISVLSLLLIKAVDLANKAAMPWKGKK
ncbi:MAG: ABC transporter permease [Clostridium sp.]|nr:ABC transporter permease [Clostridium sp.]MCM1398716.1 ABC transporter permease [Clostridium sp.]MCM1458652.1 ABC transporter permease [Bacteroides sp.]